MPLTADYTWTESDTNLQVQVPLKGKNPAGVDIFATECFLKVSFPPYLLEVDLHGCIDTTLNRATVQNGTLIIRVKKKKGHTGLWGALGFKARRKGDPKIKERRQQSIHTQQKHEQELMQRVGQRKHDDERLALRSQMSVEEAERTRIEDLKAEQKEKAEEEVYHAFTELATKQGREEAPQQSTLQQASNTCLKKPDADEKNRSHEESQEDMSTEDNIFLEVSDLKGKGEGEETLANENDIEKNPLAHKEDENLGPEEDDSTDMPANVEEADDPCDDLSMCYVPAPRALAKVEVGFTARLFPTPLRESKAKEESEWIMKNRKHLSTNHALTGKLPPTDPVIDISESDPV
ncbi:unnamed protein product [Choristocarpus tenellus]